MAQNECDICNQHKINQEKVDFFHLQYIVSGFASAHYFNCLLIKYGVALPLLLLKI